MHNWANCGGPKLCTYCAHIGRCVEHNWAQRNGQVVAGVSRAAADLRGRRERAWTEENDWGRSYCCLSFMFVQFFDDSQESIKNVDVRCRRANANASSDRARPAGSALQSISTTSELEYPGISSFEHARINMSPNLVAESIGRQCEGGALIDGSASSSYHVSLSLSCVHVCACWRIVLVVVHACIAMLPRMYMCRREHRWVATVAQAIECS